MNPLCLQLKCVNLVNLPNLMSVGVYALAYWSIVWMSELKINGSGTCFQYCIIPVIWLFKPFGSLTLTIEMCEFTQSDECWSVCPFWLKHCLNVDYHVSNLLTCRWRKWTSDKSKKRKKENDLHLSSMFPSQTLIVTIKKLCWTFNLL